MFPTSPVSSCLFLLVTFLLPLYLSRSLFNFLVRTARGCRYESLDWLGFLEALGHIVRFKELPRRPDLILAGFNSGSLVELAQALAAEGRSWDSFMADHKAEAAPEPFHERLDAFLGLLLHLWEKLPRRKAAQAKTGTPKAGKRR